jgi:3',5'-nucleoside bisphosphate phosphatase
VPLNESGATRARGAIDADANRPSRARIATAAAAFGHHRRVLIDDDGLPSFDLQSHSTRSDGALEPAEVVAAAAVAGVRLLALTDHDTVDGIGEALEAAALEGMRLSPATELSAVDGEHEDLHVLGYEIDHRNRDLLAALQDFRSDRERRVHEMVSRLREAGLTLDDSALVARGQQGRPLGRPHIADAILADPANATRLRDEGVRSRDALFARYLVPGTPTYVARARPTVEEAVAIIHTAGGVAVWAHPYWDVHDDGEVLAAIDGFSRAGLDGVEVFYATHSEPQTRLLHDHCSRHGLLMTGSTDFHGPEHDRFHVFGGFEIYGLEPMLGPIGQAASSRSSR